jgi:hypothetical protein
MKFLNWLNGKKTAIGAIVLFLATFLSEVVGGIWNVEALWLTNLIETLDWIGMAITGVGLTHKMAKKNTT